MNKTLLILLPCLVLLVGCGVYSFTGHGIAGIKTISVETFDNQTPEFGIVEEITSAVIKRLLSDRTLDLVDRHNADAILTGTVIAIDDAPLTYTELEVVSEFEFRINVEFKLTKPDQVEPIWTGRILARGSYPYRTGSLDERQIGIDKALERLTEDLINRLTSDW